MSALSRQRIGHWIIVAGVLALSETGGAQTGKGKAPLSDISLEELMNVEVSSVSRKEQKLSQTAAAVYVLTQEDIRRSGASSIPEVLRMAPGLQVAQIDANKWAVSARGFGGRFANKMLVLIDGRSVYNLLYSGVYWEQNDVMLEDVDRIEIIRGPGATMWGANAVNGVINIITKSSAETQGALVSSSVGNLEQPSAALRFGGRAGPNVTYRTYTKYSKRSNMATANGEAFDGWNSLRGGARVDWEINSRDSFTAQGDVYRGAANERVYDTFPVSWGGRPVPSSVRMSGGFGLARWERIVSDRSSFALQGYFDRQQRHESLGGADLETADLDFQHRLLLADRHDIMWGGGYRHSLSSVHTLPGSRFQLLPRDRRDHLFSVFLQDDISLLADRLVLTLGSKFQHNSYTGVEIQPSVRLIYMPTTHQAVWVAASRAVRTPSRAETDLLIEYPLPGGPAGSVGMLLGNPNSPSEGVISFEAGYRHQPWKRFSLDIAGFYNRYDHLRGVLVLPPEFQLSPVRRLVVPTMWQNGDRARTWGAEVATTFSPIRRWKLNANYTWMNIRFVPGSGLIPSFDYANSTPRSQVQMRSAFDLSRRLTFDTSAYYVSALQNLGVPSYIRLDARMGWRVSEQLELSVLGQNLLDSRHVEFLPEDYVVASQIRRAFLIRLLWIF